MPKYVTEDICQSGLNCIIVNISLGFEPLTVIQDKLFSTTLQHLSQVKCCQKLVILLQFPWQIFWQTTFLNSTISDIYIWTRHTMYTTVNHPCSFCIPLAEKKFHSDSCFSRTDTLWNTHLCVCFCYHNHLKLFKLRSKHYLSYISLSLRFIK